MYVSLLVSFWFFRGSYSRLGREIDGMDGSCRTLGHTLAAELAFIKIYISQIVLDGNGSERADLLALAAADAGSGAGLAGHGSLVLAHAGHIYAAVLRSLVAQFDDTLGAGSYTGTAGSTFFLVHLRDKGLGVDLYGSERTGTLTVPSSQAAETATCVTRIKRADDAAGDRAVVLIDTHSVLTCAVAPYHGHHRSLLLGLHTHRGRHLLHDGIAANGTELAVKRAGLHTCLGKGPAAGKAAASAVGSGHRGLDNIDERVLLHVEFLGDEKEHHREQQAQYAESDDCKNKCCTHLLLFYLFYSKYES